MKHLKTIAGLAILASLIIVGLVVQQSTPDLSPEQNQPSHWIGSWGAAPEPPRETRWGPFPRTRSFNNQTIRQTVYLSAGGEQVRLRLSNEYGTKPLNIGAASIARVAEDGEIRQETMQVVTFNGHTSGTVTESMVLTSDPVEMSVSALESIAISLYFPDDTGQCTCHFLGKQTATISEQGDFTATPFQSEETTEVRAFLMGVDVLAKDPAGTIVMLGDSTTDGWGSTPDTNSRWPDRLAERIAASGGEATWGIVNAGISGNRILNDGMGENALDRFDRDVLDVPGVTHVVVFEGINDIGFAFGQLGRFLAQLDAGVQRNEVSVERMIDSYRQLIERAHSNGLKIFGATIAPYMGYGHFSDDGELVRQAVNEWIRESGEFDAVLDFDAAVRDSDEPARIADGLTVDSLHFTDAGNQSIGDSIDLALFD